MVLRDGVVPPGLCLWTSSCMWVPNVLVVVERLVHVAAKDVLGVIVHIHLMLCPGCIHAAVAPARAALPGLAPLAPGQFSLPGRRRRAR